MPASTAVPVSALLAMPTTPKGTSPLPHSAVHSTTLRNKRGCSEVAPTETVVIHANLVAALAEDGTGHVALGLPRGLPRRAGGRLSILQGDASVMNDIKVMYMVGALPVLQPVPDAYELMSSPLVGPMLQM